MYLIEGNIGAGKSTLLKIIQENIPSVNAIFEPVNRWDKAEHGSSLLKGFYVDPKRWGYTLETYAIVCRVKDYLINSQAHNKISIMERSVFSGHYCFAKNSYMSGFMTELEWQLYLQWFDFVVTKKIELPQGFIYLRTSPELVYERIIKRSRSAESSISIDYLRDIHNRHEEFLVLKQGLSGDLAKVPVLVLDADLDFESDPAVQLNFLNKIRDFLYHGLI